jgi:hypothetical protein
VKTTTGFLAPSVICTACCSPVIAAGVAAFGFSTVALGPREWIGIAVAVALLGFLLWRLTCRHGEAPGPSFGCEAVSASSPIACTLTASDFKQRTTWIRALARESLRNARRDDLTLYLTYAPQAAPRVHEMVEKERACCAFMRFDIREDAHGVHLAIVAPEDARSAANDLFAHFAPELASPAAEPSTKEREPV